ncbi:MAG: GerMN domain-containing protein [Treponema sp.]|nr:GerMN domain-containing protein [Treponema sp.]
MYNVGIKLPPFLKGQVIPIPSETSTNIPPETPHPVPNTISENPALDMSPVPIDQLFPDAAQSFTIPDTSETPAESWNEQVRTLYFLSIDQNGDLHRIAVKRMLPNTETPLTETLEALLAGLFESEEEQRIISLIPKETKLLSVVIQQETAYINFNEEFLYNTHGKDGYAGQIKQVLWTATEFPTVKRVQILIEGRKESYLGENIWIGSVLEREQFPNF